MNWSLRKMRTEFLNCGLIICNEEVFPLSSANWKELYDIVSHSKILKEPVSTIGSQSFNIHVLRFVVEDNYKPILADNHYSKKVLKIIDSVEMRKFLKGITKMTNLEIVRCQVNFISENGQIGIHSDNEDLPGYSLTVILHFNSNYEGGEFVWYKGEDFEKIKCCLNEKSAIIMFSNVPHQILKVTKNTRCTMVIFFTNKEFRKETIEALKDKRL